MQKKREMKRDKRGGGSGRETQGRRERKRDTGKEREKERMRE